MKCNGYICSAYSKPNERAEREREKVTKKSNNKRSAFRELFADGTRQRVQSDQITHFSESNVEYGSFARYFNIWWRPKKCLNTK